jgi:hypothetical protein
VQDARFPVRLQTLRPAAFATGIKRITEKTYKLTAHGREAQIAPLGCRTRTGLFLRGLRGLLKSCTQDLVSTGLQQIQTVGVGVLCPAQTTKSRRPTAQPVFRWVPAEISRSISARRFPQHPMELDGLSTHNAQSKMEDQPTESLVLPQAAVVQGSLSIQTQAFVSKILAHKVKMTLAVNLVNSLERLTQTIARPVSLTTPLVVLR